jgi:hypothetical protein
MQAPLPQDAAKRISEISRREIVDALLLAHEPFHGNLDLISFLKRVWPLHEMPSTDGRFQDAEGDIWQHMVNNNDWSYSELLYTRLKVVDISDEQFARFLEYCVHPLVSSDSGRTTDLLSSFNDMLRHDGFAIQPQGKISGRTIYKVVSTTGVGQFGEAYEVVLSFAGEDRLYVNQVAEILKAKGVSIFYDAYEQAALWGKNLVEHLHEVYSGSARYCVIFISAHYAEKVWPSHERRSAFERAVESREEYILPARFDDTPIPGLHKTVHYIDLRKTPPDGLAALILKKLGRPH